MSKVQNLNPTLKLVFTLVFIFFVNITPKNSWVSFGLFLLLISSILFVSNLRFSDIAKRTLIATPFVIAAIPLIFTGDAPFLKIPILRGYEILISMDGFQRFLGILFKAILSIQAAIILVLTSRPLEIFFGLEQLKIPAVFISINNLAYHYLFIIREEVIRMIRARTSRSSNNFNLGSGRSVFWRAKVTGSMAGSILIRSIERSERVYSAMVSRGYNGRVIPTAVALKNVNLQDILILIGGIALVVLIWIYSLLIGP